MEAALAIEEMTASFEARLGAHRKMLAAKPSGTDGAGGGGAGHGRDRGRAGGGGAGPLAGGGGAQLLHRRAGRPAGARGDGRRRPGAPRAGGAAPRRRAGRHRRGGGERRQRCGDLRRRADRRPQGVAAAEMEMLLALRDEAVLATHALPWESASALASYHPASPPPLIRRRLSAARRLSGLHPRGATGGGGVTVGVVQVPAPASTREVQVPRRPAPGRSRLKRPEAVEADVCLLVEGTYPFVSGGVSSWVHDIILGHPELRSRCSTSARTRAPTASRASSCPTTWWACIASSVRSRRARRSTGRRAPICASEIRTLRAAADTPARPVARAGGAAPPPPRRARPSPSAAAQRPRRIWRATT